VLEAQGSEPSVKPASYGVQLTSTHEMSAPVSIPPAGFNEKIAHLIDIVKGMIPALLYGFCILPGTFYSSWGYAVLVGEGFGGGNIRRVILTPRFLVTMSTILTLRPVIPPAQDHLKIMMRQVPQVSRWHLS